MLMTSILTNFRPSSLCDELNLIYTSTATYAASESWPDRCANRHCIYWAHHADFRNQPGNQMGGSHIESRIVDFDPFGRSLLAEPVRDLAGIALFDGDFIAGCQGHVEGA